MKQKGQAMVEFALIIPIIAILLIALIYIGIMFLDYTQYSNAARDAARDIALQTKFITEENLNTSEKSLKAAALRNTIAQKINSKDADMLGRYQHPFTKIYEATWSVNFYKWNDTTKKLELNGAAGNTTAQGAKAVEVRIGMKLKGEYFGFDDPYNPNDSDPLNKSFNTLPAITYKMVLEE